MSNRNKRYTLLLVASGLLLRLYVITYRYKQNQNQQTVGDIVSLVEENSILIKNNSDALTIYFDGTTK